MEGASLASNDATAIPKVSTRNLSLDRTRTFLTLVVVFHHSVIAYTSFGHTDPKYWLGSSTWSCSPPTASLWPCSSSCRSCSSGHLSRTRRDQRTGAGWQGGPLSQGAVAKAPTAGAGWQKRPSILRVARVVLANASNARCREVTLVSRAIAGVASVATAISAADRSLSLVIRFLHWI